MPRITYSKSMAPYLLHTKGVGGVYLLHHQLYEGSRQAEYGRTYSKVRHFKQPHPLSISSPPPPLLHIFITIYDIFVSYFQCVLMIHFYVDNYVVINYVMGDNALR